MTWVQFPAAPLTTYFVPINKIIHTLWSASAPELTQKWQVPPKKGFLKLVVFISHCLLFYLQSKNWANSSSIPPSAEVSQEGFWRYALKKKVKIELFGINWALQGFRQPGLHLTRTHSHKLLGNKSHKAFFAVCWCFHCPWLRRKFKNEANDWPII